MPEAILRVGLIGCGLVGNALVEQVRTQQAQLESRFGYRVEVVAIARSRTMQLASQGAGTAIDLDEWAAKKTEGAVETDLVKLEERLIGKDSEIAILCDCTSSQEISDLYSNWLERGLNVVTANKKANSGPIEYYNKMRMAKGRFMYEANVGAGLPIISTIRDLQMTGDQFLEIQGVFSGTLSYIFNEFDGNRTFSSIVRQAKELGFTEPDPREDLSGTDVARKVVILAREIGIEVELGDVPVRSLVPKALIDQTSVSAEQFMKELPKYDSEMSAAADEASAAGEKLRYVGVIDARKALCAVELRRYPTSHQFGGLRGSDNIALLRTSRYDKNPLAIQGPGAGAEVTAAGVFADILRLA